MTQVFDRSATVKCQETLDNKYLWYNRSLFLGCRGKSSISFRRLGNIDSSFSLLLRLFISKSKKRPRYMKDSPFLTTGTLWLFTKSFGWNCRNLFEYFLIPKVTHLSTLITKFAHGHHLVKQFNRSWFSFSPLVTTAASSANWNQCTGWNMRSLSSLGEKLSCLYFSALIYCIYVLKHRLKIRGLRQSP